jgi:hypothetical protein
MRRIPRRLTAHLTQPDTPAPRAGGPNMREPPPSPLAILDLAALPSHERCDAKIKSGGQLHR